LENEKHVDCAPTNSTIDKFLNVSKINDYESVVYLIASSQNFHHLSLFKNQNSKNLKIYYGHPRDLIISKNSSYQQVT
jgi:hypothetical protein